jgi:hypothetical protein
VSCIVFALFGAFGCTTFLRHLPENTIESKLYKITPLGTSYEVATNKLAKRFSAIQFDDQNGFEFQGWPEPPRLVGIKSIEVDFGDYSLIPLFPIVTTSVTAYWGFDHNGKLIEIWVWKCSNSI